MLAKRMTIRLSSKLHSQLVHVAKHEDRSLNTIALEALEAYAEKQEAQEGRLPLGELSALLAPAAISEGIEEVELLEYARDVRERIWKERYAKNVEAVSGLSTK